MATVLSPNYPHLRIADPPVKFIDGEAEVTDEVLPLLVPYVGLFGLDVPGLDSPDPDQETDGDFDPGEATVDQVLGYLASADPDEQARVITLEREGKARKSIIGTD